MRKSGKYFKYIQKKESEKLFVCSWRKSGHIVSFRAIKRMISIYLHRIVPFENKIDLYKEC